MGGAFFFFSESPVSLTRILLMCTTTKKKKNKNKNGKSKREIDVLQIISVSELNMDVSIRQSWGG